VAEACCRRTCFFLSGSCALSRPHRLLPRVFSHFRTEAGKHITDAAPAMLLTTSFPGARVQPHTLPDI
jgi:hypothetical protein